MKSDAFNHSPFLALAVHVISDAKIPDWFYPLRTNRSVKLQVKSKDSVDLVFRPLVSTLYFTIELFIFVVSSSAPLILSWIYSNLKLLLVKSIMTTASLYIRYKFQSLSYLAYCISWPRLFLIKVFLSFRIQFTIFPLSTSEYSSLLVLCYFPTSECWSASGFSSSLILFLSLLILLMTSSGLIALNPSIS